jgi:hypothetical protein
VIKEELLTEIEYLPDYRLHEVLGFVRYLRYQESQLKGQVTTNGDGKDPWGDFIGAVSHGSLAQDIDDELYGS